MLARGVKIGLWVVAGIVVPITLGVLLALTAPVQTAVAQRVLAKVNETLTGRIAFHRVHVTLSGALALDSVRIFDADSVLIAGVDRLRVRINPLAAWREQRIQVYSLTADGVFADVLMDSTGTNLTRAISPRDTTGKQSADTSVAGPSPWVVELEKLALRGARTVLRTPDSTLFAADQWTLDADGRYGHDSLSYHLRFDVPTQLHLATTGSLVLGDSTQPLRGAVGHLTLHADTSFVRPLAPQALAAGIVDLTLDYMTRTDSVYLSTDLRGSGLGKLRAHVAAPFPFTEITGRGEILLDTLTPGSLWQDTTALLLNGRVQFTKHATATMLDGWDALVRLGATTYGAYGLSSTDLSVRLKDSTAAIQGDIDTGHGRARIDAVARGLDPKTMQLTAEVVLDRLDLHRLAAQIPDSLAPISGRITVKASSLDPQHIRAEATLDFAELALGRYALDTLVVKARMAGPEFSLDTLYAKLDTALLGVWAAGRLDGPVRYAVVGRIRDFSAMKLALKGVLPDSLTQPGDTLLQGAAILRLAGGFSLANNRVSGISVAGALRLRHARFGPYTVERASFRIDSALVDSQYFAGRITVRNFRAPEIPFPLDSLLLDMTGSPEQATGSLRLFAKADTIVLATTLSLSRSPERIAVAIDSLLASVYGINAQLEAPAQIALEGKRLTVDGLAITSDVGALRASGFVQPAGEQDLALELSGLNTGRLAELLNMPLPESTTNIRLQLSGSDKDLAGELSLRALNVVMDEHSIADEAWLHAIIDERHATVDGLMIWKGDTTMLLEGDVPARLSLSQGFVLADSLPMSGRLQLLEQPLAKLNEYLAPGMTMEGFLSSDLRFAGTVVQPTWEGTFALRDGHYRDRETGVDYRKMQIRGELEGDTLRIPSFNFTSGKRGKLIGTGWAIMAFPFPREMHLDLNFDKFQALDSRQMKARLDGHVRVNGPLDRLEADGRLEVLAAEYRISPAAAKNIEPIDLERELGLAKVDTSDSTGGFSPGNIYRYMAHQIYLDIPGNVWIRGSGAPGMTVNLELDGELWVNKGRNFDPTINGEINVREGRSTVSVLGTEYHVTQGSVVFNGPIDNPQLAVTAEQQREEGGTITVGVSGTVADMHFSLGGTSATGDTLGAQGAAGALAGQYGGIIGLGGRSQSDQPGQSGGLKGAASGAAAGQLAGLVGGLAGFDIFKFRSDNSTGQLFSGSLELGTYVTDRLFVRVLQPVRTEQSGQEVSLEYRLLEWLKVRAQQSATNASALDLLFQFDWR